MLHRPLLSQPASPLSQRLQPRALNLSRLNRFRLDVASPALGLVLGYWPQNLAAGLLLSLALGWGTPATAKSMDHPPQALSEALMALDSAANRQDLSALMQGYSNNFRHGDGLDRRDLSRTLEAFWQQYPDLTYQTEIVAWEETAQGYMAETITSIEGSRQDGQRRLALVATLRSRQFFEGDRLVRQEVISERSEVTTGDNPPTLQINLPEKVSPGSRFNFDVIVLEPVAGDLLLGGVLDEPVSAQGYGGPSLATLEPLIDSQTGTGPGGLFKIGEAPNQKSDRWISAVVMRKDGVTMVTQRLRVGG